MGAVGDGHGVGVDPCGAIQRADVEVEGALLRPGRREDIDLGVCLPKVRRRSAGGG